MQHADASAFGSIEAIRDCLDSRGIEGREALDRFRPEDRDELVHRCRGYYLGDEVVEAFQLVLAKYSDKEGVVGPMSTAINERLRALQVVPRLVFVGKLPKAALRPVWTNREAGMWGQILITQCDDPAQLDMPQRPDLYATQHDQLREKEGFEDVLASLRSPVALNVDVLSANFSWQMFVGVKGCTYSNAKLNMWGKEFELYTEAVTGAPIYVIDAKGWGAAISEHLNIPITVIPGSMAMHDWVGCIVSTYKTSYSVSKGELLFEPLGNKNVAYKGPLAECWGKTKTFIDRLPELSRSVRPPPSLTASRRIAEYLAMLLKYAFDDVEYSKALAFPELVHERMVVASYAKVFKATRPAWQAIKGVRDYMERASQPDARTYLPVVNIIAAAEECRKRRADENANAGFNSITENSTLNGHTIINKGAALVSKFDQSVGWLEREATKFGIGDIAHVDIVGYSTARGAVPALKRWAPHAVFHTFDDAAVSENPYDFTLWDISAGYPGTGQVLIDDSYDLGKKDITGAMMAKVDKILACKYPCVMVKFYVTEKMNCIIERNGSDIQMRLPAGIDRLGSHYKMCRLLANGKAHSPEVYFVGIGYQDEVTLRKVWDNILPALYLKAALMSIANDFKSRCAGLGAIIPMTRKWLDFQAPHLGREIVGQLGWSMGRITPALEARKLFVKVPGKEFSTFIGDVFDVTTIELPPSLDGSPPPVPPDDRMHIEGRKRMREGDRVLE